MTGIVFFRSADRREVCAFYREHFGAETWLEQPGCTILRYDTFLFGFCDIETDGTSDGDGNGNEHEHDDKPTRAAIDRDGTITFVYDSRAAVDRAHERVAERAHGHPTENAPYGIYNFFADDPEGRTIECQTFLHSIDPPGTE